MNSRPLVYVFVFIALAIGFWLGRGGLSAPAKHVTASWTRPALKWVQRSTSHWKPMIVRAKRASSECEVYRHLAGDEISARAWIYRNLRDRLPAEDLEALDPEGPYFKTELATRSTTMGRWLDVLAAGGWLRLNSAPQSSDLRAVWMELDRLHWQDPENAAFPLFRLALEKRMGMGDPQINASLEELARATKFDSLYTGFLRDVDRAAVQLGDPVVYFLTIEELSRVPIPDYGQLQTEVGAVLENAPQVKAHLAGLLSWSALHTTQSFQRFAYNVPEYAMARWLSDAYLPSLSELERGKEKSAEDWETFSFDESRCSPIDFEQARAKLLTLQSSI